MHKAHIFEKRNNQKNIYFTDLPAQLQETNNFFLGLIKNLFMLQIIWAIRAQREYSVACLSRILYLLAAPIISHVWPQSFWWQILPCSMKSYIHVRFPLLASAKVFFHLTAFP